MERRRLLIPTTRWLSVGCVCVCVCVCVCEDKRDCVTYRHCHTQYRGWVAHAMDHAVVLNTIHFQLSEKWEYEAGNITERERGGREEGREGGRERERKGGREGGGCPYLSSPADINRLWLPSKARAVTVF